MLSLVRFSLAARAASIALTQTDCVRFLRIFTLISVAVTTAWSSPLLASDDNSAATQSTIAGTVGGAISDRTKDEKLGAFNPYLITAHKHNFFMPLSYTTNVNESAYELQNAPDNLTYKPYEVNFQISLKSQVNQGKLLFEGDALYFGMTLESWWQLYNSPLSSPFRETNYQPEVFYTTPLAWRPLSGKSALVFGLEHQSNGQLQGLSRSWNRIYAQLIYERKPFVFSLKPWYRIPESEKQSPQDAEGDDNPDIKTYFGSGEIAIGWKNSIFELLSTTRYNSSSKKGAVDTTLTFPLFGRFRGMVHYFNGYGDSLIDYNRFQRRFGFGVALTNLL